MILAHPGRAGRLVLGRYNWNSVEIRYCDGASVSGDKATPTKVGNATLHFRGR